MPRTSPFARVVVIAAAILALAAPSALARPLPPTERQQDLRHLEAGNSISRDSRDLGPVYWSYDYDAPAPASARPVAHDPAPASARPVAHDPAPSDDGAPWALIAAGIAAICVCAAGAAVATGRRRMHPRAT
jgi:hypothetical protein